jgi:plastocyanin
MIACGPLQAIYLLAASSGSPYQGATYLFSFGVGTLPVLLGFGIITSVVSSKIAGKILRLSGIVVILLGLIMVNRGISLTGTGYDAKSLTSAKVAEFPSAYAPALSKESDAKQYQTIRMNVTSYGWQPDTFVLKKGIPVRWIIDGQQITSCNSAIQVPQYNMKFNIRKGTQTIEFTPNEAGTVPFSCWMGMIPGTFIVKE